MNIDITTFPKRLKDAMDQKGITASELSRQSGVGKNLISYYLHGRCFAKQDKVFLLAKALEVDPGWLMTGVEQKREECTLAFSLDAGGFSKILAYMSNYCFEDYKTVVDLFNKTYEKMKKEGIEL